MVFDDFWQLLAGLALFMYGMLHLEDSLKQLEGRSFKLYLRKYTTNKLSGIVSGTTVTALLQSSSIVNLLLLSFVGAGIISMKNGLAVAFGANLGGTVNSWLVALFGFKLELISYTYPVIGIAGIGMILFREKKRIFLFCKFFTGIGLLFLGLEFVKSGMEITVKNFDFGPYLGAPLIIFVLIGFIITALIQTSAATVVLVLGALNASVIPLETGIAVVLGAELGTTLKIIIGAVGGNAAKKRLAAGNSIFNLVTSMLGFIFLTPIANMLQTGLGLHDPLLVLVAFQSFANLGGVILFYFFLNSFASFLEKKFPDKFSTSTYFITASAAELNDAAVEMFEKEIDYLLQRAIQLNMDLFEIEIPVQWKKFVPEISSTRLNLNEQYLHLKQTEGEILSIFSKLSMTDLDAHSVSRLQHLLSAARHALYSVKSLRDTDHNMRELKNSGNEDKYQFFHLLKQELSDFYLSIHAIYMDGKETESVYSELLSKCTGNHEMRVNRIISTAVAGKLPERDISTLLNVSRELLASEQSVVASLNELHAPGRVLLDEKTVTRS